MSHPTMLPGDWQKLFDIRCKSKRGEKISDVEAAYVMRCHTKFPDAYKAMESEIFKATKPFGSRI